MINNQLLDYIRQQLSSNISKDVIITNLKSQGWTDADLNEAFTILSVVQQVPTAPIMGDTTQLQQNGVPTTNFKNSASSFFHKHKKIFSIIVVLLCVGAAGVGVYAYYSGAFISFPDLVSKAFENIQNTKGFSYETNLSMDIPEIKNIDNNTEGQLLTGLFIPQKIDVTTKGSYDISDKNNVKMLLNASLNAGLFSLDGEARMVDKVFYIKLTKVPSLGIFPTESFKDKWFSISFNKTDNIQSTKEGISITPTLDADFGFLDNLTPEQKDRFYKIIQNAHFIKLVEKLPMDIVNNQTCYHFVFNLDREGIVSVFQEITNYVSSVNKDGINQPIDLSSLSTELQKIEDFKGELWVGRKDNLPYKLSISFVMKPDLTTDEKIKVSGSSIFSNWNQPITIDVPTESTSLEEFISGAMGGNIEQAKENSMEASIKANLVSLRAEAEVFYDKGNSYLGFCSSSKVKDARKNIEDNKGTGFICKNKPEAYAIETKLPKDAGYWCVDSTGVSKSVTSVLSGVVCPTK